MANTLPTSADIIAVNSSEKIVGAIMAVLMSFPELALFPAGPVKKTSYNTLVVTGLPTVAFRAINAGRNMSKPTLTTREVACMLLDGSWQLDVGAAQKNEWGIESAQDLQRRTHLAACLAKIAGNIWYGLGADAAGFTGLGTILANNDDTMVVDAKGDTAAGCTSVFAVRFGIEAICLAWGMEGGIVEEPITIIPADDGTAAGKTFPAYYEPITGWVGLQNTDYEAAGRICNVDFDHPLDDDMLSDIYTKFKVGKKPSAYFLTRAALNMLRKSRAPYNPNGTPAPFPTDWNGVPIVVTDSILDTETPLEASGT